MVINDVELNLLGDAINIVQDNTESLVEDNRKSE